MNAPQGKQQVTHARIYAPDSAALADIVSRHSVDYGCRPKAMQDESEDWYTPAVLSPQDVQRLRDEQIRVEIHSVPVRDETSARTTISQEDRFDGGQVAPQGAGSRGEDQI